MDPYLESPTHWSDFHHEYTAALRETINARLPSNYAARIGELVMVVAPAFSAQSAASGYIPDISISRKADSGPSGAGTTIDSADGGVATAQPFVLANIELIDDFTESYIEIVRVPGLEVVTVVELLSPTNK